MLTIDKTEELELFRFLSSQPRLKEWLQSKLDMELRVLVSNNDADQIRRAQGRAQLLQTMIDLLDKSHTATR